MSALEAVESLARRLVSEGVCKDEETAVRFIAAGAVERRIEEYRRRLDELAAKHGADLDSFAEAIRGTATPEQEDDWMEWKAANEMLQGWREALRAIVCGGP
jgi:hypothetical protein